MIGVCLDTTITQSKCSRYTFRPFDFAPPDISSPKREATTVPQQALYLLNAPFVIQQAKAQCDRLIVGLNSDASTKRLKGPTRPIQNENVRAQMLAARVARLIALRRSERAQRKADARRFGSPAL